MPEQAIRRLAHDTEQTRRRVAAIRAGAAVLWAVLFFAALHGRHILSAASIPTLVGLLVIIYPTIDLASSLTQRRLGSERELVAAIMLDSAAIIALIITAVDSQTMSVLVVFGLWALVSGLLMLPTAWRQLANARLLGVAPLLLSGAISAFAGTMFVTAASHRTAPLSNLGGYALLGAVFFLVFSAINRATVARPGSTVASS